MAGVLLQREGWRFNHELVHRLYREEGLQMRHKRPKRRVSAKLREDRCDATASYECWGMDFMADELFNGRRLRAEGLKQNWFLSLDDAIEKIGRWRIDYDLVPPHCAIGNLTLVQYNRLNQEPGRVALMDSGRNFSIKLV